MAGGGEGQTSLEQTPTWVVSVVCAVFIIASLLLERSLHRLGKRFKRSGQKELFHALEQIKNELMLLGFISLLLTVFQPKVASICMSERLAHRMLPCPYEPVAAGAAAPAAARRRLFAAEASASSTCKSGQVPVISVEALHQLHIFIFVLAVVHVVYSCLTILVGLLQVKSWERWEVEAREDAAKVADKLANKKKHHNPLDHPDKAHEHGINFAKGRIKYQFLHSSITGLNLDAYIYCFFRQFGKPIYKEDYMALRFGFIGAHHLSHTYDFHGYIRRTMESDFKRVVGISAYLWAFVCIFLLLDITGWYTYFWIAFIPTILVLIVGTKLQHIIIDLAIEVRGGLKRINLDDLDDGLKSADHPGAGGAVQVRPINPTDDLFWFSRPRILIQLIHFILFQNAFELAFFFWALFEYGFDSCLVGKKWMIIVRLGMGLFVQVLCSASTLPLYALVSQMGSTPKGTIFKENTVSAIHGWHENAKKRTKSKHHHLSHHLGGIIGLTKEKDAEGHVRDLDRPNGPGHPPHAHPPQHHDASHSIEIGQEPLVIVPVSESDDSKTAPPPPPATKPAAAFGSIAKLALEKERGKQQGPKEGDVP